MAYWSKINTINYNVQVKFVQNREESAKIANQKIFPIKIIIIRKLLLVQCDHYFANFNTENSTF